MIRPAPKLPINAMKRILIHLIRNMVFGHWEWHWGWSKCRKHGTPIHSYSRGMVDHNYCDLCDVDRELKQKADDEESRRLKEEYLKHVTK